MMLSLLSCLESSIDPCAETVHALQETASVCVCVCAEPLHALQETALLHQETALLPG